MISVIPVRGGSVRVPHKNSRPFAGSSLLEICIRKLKQLGLDVVVSSESDELLTLAKSCGAIDLKRPEHLATSETNPRELAHYLADVLLDDLILYVHCTAPMIKPETIKQMLELDWAKFDSVNSASLIKKHLWMDGQPVNYDFGYRPNTQQLPEVYALNYAVNLISRDKMLEYSDFVGKNPLLHPIPDDEAIDIDTPFDFEMAELWYNKRRENTL